MPTFNNLPGVLVNTLDGGLVARRIPTSKSTLILGTAGIGPAGNPYPVTDKAVATALYGVQGNLTQALEEVSASSDNVILYRIGTTPATLTGIGETTLGVPSTPTTTVVGTAGVTSLTYVIVAKDASGTTLPSLPVTVTTANATLTSENYVTVSWSSLAGATSYDVLKLAGSSAPTGTGSFFLANVSGVTYNDQGGALTTYTVPTVDTSGNPGISISLGAVTSTAATDYTVWYSTGVLYLYYKGTLVYSNDPTYLLDSGDSIVSGTASAGTILGSGESGQTGTAITLTAAAATSGTSTAPAPVFSAAVTGLGMTTRQTYVALVKAFDLLDSFPVDQVFVPGVYIDAPNVALKATVDSSSAGTVLDWLSTTTSTVDGHPICQWASEDLDSDGNTVSPQTFETATDRLAAGFHEVNFAYQLARFCALQDQVTGSCIGFIGVQAMTRYDVSTIRKWVGVLPTYDPVSGNPLTPGTGVLGIPCLVGTTASSLSSLCADFAAGFRAPGLFDTDTGEYDGTRNTDANGNPVDIGRLISVVGDWAYMSNGFGNYVNSIAGTTAGICASLDPKNSLTNTPVTGVQQLYQTGPFRLDELTAADVNVLRFKGTGILPALLHDKTAANPNSDYIYLSRVRIQGLLVNTIRKVADKFIGKASSDGMQLSAMKTALDSAALTLQKNGYIQNYSFTITSTQVEQRLGHALVQVSFMPAMELVQLTAQVGISRS